MLFQILKKDMMKRKVVNTILFLFITLSTVFLASSVNNILVVSSAVDYYLDYGKVPDVTLLTNEPFQKAEIQEWLDEQLANHSLNDYEYDELLTLSNKAVQADSGNGAISLQDKGDNFFLGTMRSNYNKVFDQDGNSFTLEKGEVAIPISMADNNDLEIGDTIYTSNNANENVFVVKEIIKDAAYGNEMVGMIRIIISEEDFDAFPADTGRLGLYNIMTDDDSNMIKSIEAQEYDSVMNIISSDIYTMVYSFDMILAALLILVGICLILIAMLVLRFTLIFTMEEQYREIGILKAIGLRNFNVKKLYLIKYLVIVTAGAILGICLSIPISSFMIQSVSYNMIMEDGEVNVFINILCASFIIILILSFCYYCTRKLNKVSAIDAIRGGDNGERFNKIKGYPLTSCKRIPVFIYLAINDIRCHLRRYAVLIVTFCICFILTTIPLNTLYTMSSKEMISKFNLDTESEIFVRSIEAQGEEKYSTVNGLKSGMDRLKKQMMEQGYDTEIKAGIIFFIRYVHDDVKQNVLTMQLIGNDANFLRYSDGSAPVLENEIAFSEPLMKQNGWEIGDYVEAKFNGVDQDFIITGTYTDYMQLGKSARLNPAINNDQEVMFDYWSIMVDMETDKTSDELITEMQSLFPEYEWMSGQAFIDQNVGGIQQILKSIIAPMTAMLCVLIMLITLLMEKLFITREKGEIAMMKSIGFANRTIRLWQVTRMVFVAFTSMVISIPLALLSNQYVLKPIFSIMGADVAIQVNPLDVYVIYPGILLIGIVIATFVASRAVKRIDIREINNVE